MASLHTGLTVTAAADDVWNAIRDFGEVHLRVAAGFVADCRRDGDVRIVTFANGHVVREVLVACDDAHQRLIYAIPPNERIVHYQGQFVVSDAGDGRCRIDWTVDLLPDAIAPVIAAQMELGIAAMRNTFERSAG